MPGLPAEVCGAALTLLRAAYPDDHTLARLLENGLIAHLSADEARQLVPVVTAEHLRDTGPRHQTRRQAAQSTRWIPTLNAHQPAYRADHADDV